MAAAWLRAAARWIDRNPRLAAVGLACVPLAGGVVLFDLTVGSVATPVLGAGWKQRALEAQLERDGRGTWAQEEAAGRRAQLKALLDGLETKSQEEKLAAAADAFYRFNQGPRSGDGTGR